MAYLQELEATLRELIAQAAGGNEAEREALVAFVKSRVLDSYRNGRAVGRGEKRAKVPKRPREDYQPKRR